MGAASLPNPQASMPAGFAAFLSTIGQTPSVGGEDGGFDQLVAAAPLPTAASAKAAMPIPDAGRPAMPTVTHPVATPTSAPAAAASISPAIDAPVVAAKAGETSTAVLADPDAAAASAAKLLIAVNGSTPAPQPRTVKVAEPKTGAATENGSAPHSDTDAPDANPVETAAQIATTSPDAAAMPTTAATAMPAEGVAVTRSEVVATMPVVAAIGAPVVGKPVKPNEAAAILVGETAPATDLASATPLTSELRPASNKPAAAASDPAPVATPMPSKPQSAPPTLPQAVAAPEAQSAKPAETAPSMTVQFAQPAALSVAMATSSAPPVPIAERILDLASDGAWIDQLAHDIAATRSDSGDISFRLMPRHLGRLDVAMLMRDDGVSLKLDTQHEAAATIVTAAQGRLVEDLRQQGVRVAGSEVSCTPGDGNRQMQGQSQGQGRAAPPDVSHLIETVTERVKARDSEEAADRRGRFA